MNQKKTIYKIRDVFDKERDPLRELNTVIKVNDATESSIWTEFEEFVLTEALVENLCQFYQDFTASIEFDGPKMPYWLEGFYGSGKSHFSKIIGYLFQNSILKDHNGKSWNTIEFFTENILKECNYEGSKAKKAQQFLLENISLFPKQFRCRTLFINLSSYSKSETSADDFMESFKNALLKEFNKSIGLADSIEIAEVEKNLIREGIYDQFKQFAKVQQNEEWEEIRKSGPWARRTFINVYSEITKCDKIEAEAYISGAESDCRQKNIDNILEEINKWTDSNLSFPEKGIQGKFLIILDEAGLFFSAKASRIGEMMNAAEWVNNPEKKSRINMIFNAQQSIKTYFESIKKNIDYRTAEQRFKHWFLDKKNIQSVVVKRWLKKDKQMEEEYLKPVIDQNYPKIIDGTFMDTIKDTNSQYNRPSREEICETYPFVPYQFPLMIQITQELISEKIVEEQFGGKTRSILSMTRDVLNNSTWFSKNKHFVDEPINTFVTLPQIYDCVTYTLKNKEEDQFILVESASKLHEDPKIFSQEERDLSFSYLEIMKSILIFKYIPEIYSSDQNIAKSLFNSLSCNKTLIIQKVKKLIKKLKQEGYISYDKKEIKDINGNPKEIWEYKIASQEEKKWIKKTQSVYIAPDDIQKRFYEFLKNSEGKKLINLRDQIFISKFFDELNNEFSISNPVKLKCVWIIDPIWDEKEQNFNKLESRIYDLKHDEMLVGIISPKTLRDHQKNLKKLELKLKTIAAQTLRNQKIMMFICPSFTASIENIANTAKFIEDYLRECIKIEETIKKDQTIPGNIRRSFNKRILDIEKDILSALKEIFNEGMILYGNNQQIRISQDNIDNKVLLITKKIFSQINNKAHLGQFKPNISDIVKILNWDPKKKSTIPTIFRSSSKSFSSSFSPNSLNFFDEKGMELKPNYSQQITLITQEFNRIKNQNKEIEFVSGKQLKTIFQSPPYNWTDQTILSCIAALLRNNEWDVIKGSTIFDCNDKQIIEIFKDSKQNYAKFQELKFKIAERLTQEQRNNVNSLLKSLFNHGISKVGPEMLNDALLEISKEVIDVFNSIKEDLSKLALTGDILAEIENLYHNMEKIQSPQRIYTRISKFLDLFRDYLSNTAQIDKFSKMRKTLYRIAELKKNNMLERYYWLDEFNTKIMRDWLTGNRNQPDLDIPHLEEIITDVTTKLHDPEYLFEDKWNSLWNETQEYWNIYWKEYRDLHDSLKDIISSKISDLEKHLNFKYLEKDQINILQNAFSCDYSPETPSKLENNIFSCPKCNIMYSRLQVIKLQDIEQSYQQLKSRLDAFQPQSIKKTHEVSEIKKIDKKTLIESIIDLLEQKEKTISIENLQQIIDILKKI